ncbi:MAG: DNA replication and repair protein RecF [Candidatus Roizmanbacteria bacterium]
MIKKLFLRNFRNFEKNSFDFSPRLTIIVGKNSLGKTNLLEGIYFLVNGVGFREVFEEELVLFGKKEASVEAIIIENNEPFSYQINTSLFNNRIRKKFFINKTEKKKPQYLNSLTKTVLFSPEQINIIIGSPKLRRDYFNKTISIFDLEYKNKLNNYEAALRKRNKILESRFSEEKLKEELVFWDDYLIKQGEYLTKKRQSYVDFLNQNKKFDSKSFSIEYLKNEITKEKLKENFNLEVRLRRTIIGPQKDDFQISISGKNVHHFGSRSEQRLSVFWLKLNEIRCFENQYKKKPIILLDDIFSELDRDNQKIIVDLVKEYQTVTTTTEKKLPNLINLSNNGAYHTIDL